MVVTFAVYLLAAMAERKTRFTAPNFLKSPYFYAFLAIFVLAMDFWRWNKKPSLLLGFPSWVIYFIGLSAAQTIVAWVMVKGKK